MKVMRRTLISVWFTTQLPMDLKDFPWGALYTYALSAVATSSFPKAIQGFGFEREREIAQQLKSTEMIELICSLWG